MPLAWAPLTECLEPLSCAEMNPSVAALGALGALPLEAACHSPLAIQSCMRAHSAHASSLTMVDLSSLPKACAV